MTAYDSTTSYIRLRLGTTERRSVCEIPRFAVCPSVCRVPVPRCSAAAALNQCPSLLLPSPLYSPLPRSAHTGSLRLRLRLGLSPAGVKGGAGAARAPPGLLGGPLRPGAQAPSFRPWAASAARLMHRIGSPRQPDGLAGCRRSSSRLLRPGSVAAAVRRPTSGCPRHVPARTLRRGGPRGRCGESGDNTGSDNAPHRQQWSRDA